MTLPTWMTVLGLGFLSAATTFGADAVKKKHVVFVTSVSFSPDGKRIVSGSGDKTVKVGAGVTGPGTWFSSRRSHT